MYYPYFRGKQNELIVIRELAASMKEAAFVPIIEPVREQIRGLQKALDALCEAGTDAVVIANPRHGQLAANDTLIIELLKSHFAKSDNLSIGIQLHDELNIAEALALCASVGERQITLIHAGFKEANEFVLLMNDYKNISTSVFLEDDCGKLYQKKFRAHPTRILIRDGCERRRNRDHPETEFFSDLHLTYKDERMTGFGDFLIVGDDYSESGGPAYTIAIHLTYIDADQDEAMFVHHFLSDRQDTAADPGGKFAEALEKLITAIDAGDSKFYKTTAIDEFRELHKRSHYPGLGYLKKLSMKHHIETLALFFESEGNGAE